LRFAHLSHISVECVRVGAGARSWLRLYGFFARRSVAGPGAPRMWCAQQPVGPAPRPRPHPTSRSDQHHLSAPQSNHITIHPLSLLSPTYEHGPRSTPEVRDTGSAHCNLHNRIHKATHTHKHSTVTVRTHATSVRRSHPCSQAHTASRRCSAASYTHHPCPLTQAHSANHRCSAAHRRRPSRAISVSAPRTRGYEPSSCTATADACSSPTLSSASTARPTSAPPTRHPTRRPKNASTRRLPPWTRPSPPRG
jgi:hypothetical protein